MHFNPTLSAIMRGKWLIDKQWADAHMPMVLAYMGGETVDFGHKDSVKEDINPTLLIKSAGKKGNVYGVNRYTSIDKMPEGSIAMVTLSGPMVKQDAMCGPAGMITTAKVISQLGAADNIDGILLNIDSPGGQADGTALLSDVIKNASAQKPIIAVIDDGMAASAAMWIASAANEIYCTQPTDQVGSIGVYTQVADWNKYYKDKHKLDVQDIYAPQSTDKNKDYRDAIKGDTSGVEDDLSVLADQFINTVATNRSTKIKGDKWKTGKMFYAKDAQKQGLIDGIKSFGDVVQRMQKLVNYPTPSQNKNSKNMAFKKTMTAAKAESFEVAEGGFLLQEEQLNNIEAALTNAELSTVALDQANATIQTLNDEAATAATLTGNQATRIADLEAQIAVLDKKPSGTGTSVVTKKDETEENGPKPTYLSDTNASNAWADKQLARRKPKAE